MNPLWQVSMKLFKHRAIRNIRHNCISFSTHTCYPTNTIWGHLYHNGYLYPLPRCFYFIPFPIPVHNRAFFHSTQHILHESRASFKINNSSLFCFDLDCSYCLLRIGHIVHIIFRVSWIIYIGTFLKVCCMYMLHSRFNIKSFSYEVKCHAHLKNHNSWYVMILYSINHVEWLS